MDSVRFEQLEGVAVVGCKIQKRYTSRYAADPAYYYRSSFQVHLAGWCNAANWTFPNLEVECYLYSSWKVLAAVSPF